jgi:3-oxoacid CoA-transferase
VNKTFPSPAAAIADIERGATIAIAGFGVGHSYPNSLVVALRDKGVDDLCLVANSLGSVGEYRPQILVESGQIRRLVVSFSVRPGLPSPEEESIRSGKVQLEMVPQGILVERLRAAGAGLPAFYSPATAGTPLAAGKEVRTFGGRECVLETAIPVDFAFIRGYRADTLGNVEFRGSSAHFNASFAKAAKVAIVEVAEIVEPGVIPPERVDLPGIFVSRVVQSTVTYPPPRGSVGRRAPDSARDYFGKPALTRSGIARRAAALLPHDGYVNLGSGLPTLIASHVAGRAIQLHAENGALGYDLLDDAAQWDGDFFDAAGNFIRMRPGGALFDSVVSFEIARSGKLSAVVLGAYQVSQSGDLANWSAPGQLGGGIGGAMDLTSSGSPVIVVMEICDSKGNPKLVPRCTYALTAVGCVDVVVTDVGLFRRRGERFTLEELAPDFTVADIRRLAPIEFAVAPQVGDMQ